MNRRQFLLSLGAATVASGQVDVGFGIAAAAARYDLGFVPLTWDRYCLALRAGTGGSPPGATAEFSASILPV